MHFRVYISVCCNLLLLFWLPTVCALKITAFGQCKSLDIPAIRISALDTEDGPINANICVEQCSRRPGCKVASFARQYPLCYLFDSETVLDTSGDTVKDCIYILKEDFEDENQLVSFALSIAGWNIFIELLNISITFN